MVFVPAARSEEAVTIVTQELTRLGLKVDTSKTVAWTRDPSTALPEALTEFRKPSFTCLGATATWMDNEDPLARLPVHAHADGEAALQEAVRFRSRLAQLRAGGLDSRSAFQLLQTFSAGCVTHLLRANYEQGAWVRQLDDVWAGIVEDLAGSPLNEQQRQQLFLKLRDGGLGLTSAADTAPLGFLASWALVVPEVAGAVGFVSWSTFAERCSNAL